MKKTLALMALVPMMGFAKTSTPEGFTDDLDAAFAAAQASGKYVYACFSGSDWCGWCKRLEKEVFASKEFLDGVTNDYVLVFIDSPANKGVLSERAKVENPKLTKKYNIKGFPSALVFTAEGEKITETGYRQGGAAKYAEYLMGVRKEGPALKRKEAAQKAYVGPFKARQRKILDDLRAEILELQKKPVAEAAAKVEALAKEFEAAPVPEGMKEAHDAYLDELRDLQKKMK